MTFVDFVTPVPADWLNNVNTFVNTSPTPAQLTTLFNFANNFSHKNILDFGGNNDGVHDNSAALAAAIAACPPNQVSIIFPPGTYYFASGQVMTTTSTPTNSARISLVGAGGDATKIKCAPGVTAFTVAYPNAYTSVKIEGMSFLAPSAGTSSAIALIQQGTIASGGFGTFGITLLRDLLFYGQDGWNQADYWATCIGLIGVSNINIYDCFWQGPTGTPSGTGVSWQAAPNDSGLIPVVCNITNCSAVHLAAAVLYGGNTQGLNVISCNFTANFVGIINPGNGTTPNDQMNVIGCQLNNINESILCQGLTWPCQAVTISSNLFLVENNSAGITINKAGQTIISGNSFGPQNASPVSQIGVIMGTYNQGATVITGNMFDNITLGVQMLSGSQWVNLQSNAYSPGIGGKFSNAGTNNTIGGGSV
jgi:hypothetical protein